VKCELLLINPCGRELFARCTGKNIERLQTKERERVPVADRVFRMSWHDRDGPNRKR
jgi:hypothetical protein